MNLLVLGFVVLAKRNNEQFFKRLEEEKAAKASKN